MADNSKMLLLYIHGFASSPASHKARATQAWLVEHAPEIRFCCPALSPFPDQAMAQLENCIAEASDEEICLAGSSMGGFYAAWLAEKYGCKAVLINPAVRPWQGGDQLLGEQRNYHTGEPYVFEQKHLDALRKYEVPNQSHPQNIWILLQTGDEVLDYRQAVEKYQGSRVTVEEGGDHSFQDYERFLPEIAEFFNGQ